MITTREQQIIDLHEQGIQAPQIANRMELTVEYVRRRISCLCHGTGPDDAHLRAMEMGSRALREAIVCEHVLNPEERRLLCYIHGYQLEHGGQTPSIADCATALEMPKTATFERIHKLTAVGAIRRRAGEELSIEVLMKPRLPTINGTPLYMASACDAGEA